MDKDIYLTKVKKSDKASLMELREEFERNGERSAPGSSGFLDYPTFEDWFKFVKLCEKQETIPRKDYVPAVQYLLKRRSDGKILGVLQIRSTLNEHLFKFGGHFGGSIRPSERNKNYSTEMIKLGLKKAKRIGLDKILITCRDGNFASEKSILKAGGVYENTMRFNDEDSYKRFWIKT